MLEEERKNYAEYAVFDLAGKDQFLTIYRISPLFLLLIQFPGSNVRFDTSGNLKSDTFSGGDSAANLRRRNADLRHHHCGMADFFQPVCGNNPAQSGKIGRGSLWTHCH